MTTTTRPVERHEADRIERELLGRLGLGADATKQEIEEAHDRLAEFLESAPHDLRRWAATELAAADEAYALLSDQSALDAQRSATVAPAPAPKPVQAPVRTIPNRGATVVAAAPAVIAADDEPLPEELEETEGAGMPVARPKARKAARPAVGAERVKRTDRGPLIRRLALAGAAVVAIAVAFVVYNAGAPAVPGVNGTAAPEASATPAVDPSAIAALMQKITTNPKDVDSYVQLGNTYFDAGDYTTAATFMEKALALDPNNLNALVGHGASQFNLGNPDGAKADWQKVVSLDPKNVEAHYDLGFLYLNQNPPDMTQVKAEWQKVIDIDPTSDIAKNVQTHLAAFASASPGGSPAASGAASAAPASSAPQTSGSPAASGN